MVLKLIRNTEGTQHSKLFLRKEGDVQFVVSCFCRTSTDTGPLTGGEASTAG
jgi:hypothetical protein